MSQTTLYPVVMAGGSGSRLWPLSRVLYPKQFLCLKGDLTMLQTTVNRLHGVECESPVVICNEQHRFIVAEQLRQLNKLTENIIRSLPDAIPHRLSPWRRWRQNAAARTVTR